MVTHDSLSITCMLKCALAAAPQLLLSPGCNNVRCVVSELGDRILWNSTMSQHISVCNFGSVIN